MGTGGGGFGSKGGFGDWFGVLGIRLEMGTGWRGGLGVKVEMGTGRGGWG